MSKHYIIRTYTDYNIDAQSLTEAMKLFESDCDLGDLSIADSKVQLIEVNETNNKEYIIGEY